MKRAHRHWILALVAVSTVALGLPVQAQQETAVELQLRSVAASLRMGMSVAAIAVYSPTVSDVRLLAQRLVNLIEGAHGPHYLQPKGEEEADLGLLPGVLSIATQTETYSLDPDVRVRLAAAVQNVTSYLSLARDAALSSLSDRRLERAAEDMRQVYAYLEAAYEVPCILGESAALPALGTIMRLLGVDRELAN